MRHALVLIFASVAIASGPGPETVDAPPDLRLPGVGERLAALEPTDPLAYFELAEEIAAEFRDETGRRRARQLFVLALELDRGVTEAGSRLAPSVYRALAALSDDPFEHRWLSSLSDTEAPGRLAGAGDAPVVGALAAAESIGAFRASDASEARRAMSRPGATAALDAAARAVPAFAPMLGRIPDVPACPTCRNRLILKPAIGSDVPLQICPTCRGNPGPALSATEFVATLRAEDLLIDPLHRRWSAQVFVSGGEPIAESGARDLAGHFVVDPDLPYFHPAESAEHPLAGNWSDRPARLQP